MDIIQLQPLDWQRLKNLRISALTDSPDAFDSTLQSARELSDSQWQARVLSMPTFVAVEDGLDVGMVRCVTDDDDSTAAYLISMWVSPAWRKKGAGAALVNSIIDWSRAEGYDRITLDVADKNAAAIALYKRMNFLPTGVTSTLAPPREHITEHQRVLYLR